MSASIRLISRERYQTPIEYVVGWTIVVDNVNDLQIAQRATISGWTIWEDDAGNQWFVVDGNFPSPMYPLARSISLYRAMKSSDVVSIRRHRYPVNYEATVFGNLPGSVSGG